MNQREQEQLRLISRLISHGERTKDVPELCDAFEMCKALDYGSRISVEDKEGRILPTAGGEVSAQAHEYSRLAREAAERLLASGSLPQVGRLLDLDVASLLFDAPYDFDAFCRYTETEREDDKQFYLPRRKQLYPVAKALQDLEMGRITLLAISMPPGVGKSTLAEFFLVWTSGRHWDMQSLALSHNLEFMRGVYGEVLRMMSPKGEYLWSKVFPKVPIVGTSAKDLRIDLGKRKRFETLEFASMEQDLAGKVRATNILYCDDLVGGIEQAMNRDAMDKLWRNYTSNALQRKLGNFVKELHIATRWSLNDVVGRLEQSRGGSEKSRFINIPVLDEEGKSQFFYPYGLGYTTEACMELKENMDNASWNALYMGSPVEYEGQLYAEEELRRYFSLPDREPDAIIAVCDTKTTGGDYCVLPIIYKYGPDCFVEDVVCENYAPDICETNVIQMLLKHDVQAAQFESNVAGGKMAQVVQEKINEVGGRTKITTKWTQSNKETKILVNSAWVKQHCLFKDNSIIKGNKNSEYRIMLKQLCGYSLAGKNKHDDVPDAFAQLALYVNNMTSQKIKLQRRWF